MRGGILNGRIRPLCIPLVVAAIVLVTANSISADENSPDKSQKADGLFSLRGYSGGLGVTLKQVTLDLMTGSDHLVVATIGNALSPFPVLNLQSPVRYFGASKLGYYLRWEYGLFKLNIQESFTSSNPRWEDMGTSVGGYFVSATPFLVVDTHREADSRFRMWLGLGLGYLSVRGDVIVYEDAEPDRPFREVVDITEPALNCTLTMEFIGAKGQFGTKIAWLQSKTDGYHYYLSEAAITFFFNSKF